MVAYVLNFDNSMPKVTMIQLSENAYQVGLFIWHLRVATIEPQQIFGPSPTPALQAAPT